MRRTVFVAALCTLSLSGCVDSAAPILPDAQPILGEHLRLQFYSLHKGYANEPEQAAYKWNGARYVRTSGGMRDVAAFSVHPFEGTTFIVQSAAAKRARITEYAIASKLTDGVYQVVAIDEDDADASARAAHCKKTDDSGCRIATSEQLFAFARATAVRRKDEGGLVIRLSDDAERSPRRPMPPHRR